MNAYIPHHSVIEVKHDGAWFVVDADISEGPVLVYGIKIGDKWWHAEAVLNVDFCEELEQAIREMPLNSDGDVPSWYKP